MKKTQVVFAVILLLCASFGAKAESPDEAESKGAIRYAVKAILPDNQIDGQGSSFNLLVAPGQEQVLEVIVKNKSDQEIEVALEANPAYTNENGVIEFDAQADGAALPAAVFSQIITPVEPVITIPPQSEVVARFSASIPEEPFDGVIYGGLLFTKLNQEDDRDMAGVGVRNIYRYAVVVRLRVNEADVAPMFEISRVSLDQSAYPALLLDLKNPVPLLARGITLRANVYEKGSQDTAISVEKRNVDMAPNSSCQYKIRMAPEQALKPGEYRVLVEMEFDGRLWTYEQDLSVR